MRVRIGIAAELKGVSPSTLRRWEKEEKLTPIGRTKGGHRRYKMACLLGKKEKDEKGKKVVLEYARVSAANKKMKLEDNKNK